MKTKINSDILSNLKFVRNPDIKIQKPLTLAQVEELKNIYESKARESQIDFEKKYPHFKALKEETYPLCECILNSHKNT